MKKIIFFTINHLLAELIRLTPETRLNVRVV